LDDAASSVDVDDALVLRRAGNRARRPFGVFEGDSIKCLEVAGTSKETFGVGEAASSDISELSTDGRMLDGTESYDGLGFSSELRRLSSLAEMEGNVILEDQNPPLSSARFAMGLALRDAAGLKGAASPLSGVLRPEVAAERANRSAMGSGLDGSIGTGGTKFVSATFSPSLPALRSFDLSLPVILLNKPRFLDGVSGVSMSSFFFSFFLDRFDGVSATSVEYPVGSEAFTDEESVRAS